MKKVLYKRSVATDKRSKFLAVQTRSEDKDSKTLVRKSFMYKVAEAGTENPQIAAPQVFIKKSLDTKKRIERFQFRVQGAFYLNHNRMLMKVDFEHTLHILIFWKHKIFSPKKSAVLT